MEAKRKNL